MRLACTRHYTFLILHECRHACTRKIDDVETLVQRTCVRTTLMHQVCVHVRRVHAKAGLRAPWHVYES